MSNLNLSKGFEVELFTGSFNSHIGVSADIEKNFSNFVKEPDNRNDEYITTPEKDYKFLYEKLITPRKNLRHWLNNKITDNHSQRWIQFPKTPSKIPFFTNHNSYIDWIE